jgi:hypothetical protein
MDVRMMEQQKQIGHRRSVSQPTGNPLLGATADGGLLAQWDYSYLYDGDAKPNVVAEPLIRGDTGSAGGERHAGGGGTAGVSGNSDMKAAAEGGGGGSGGARKGGLRPPPTAALAALVAGDPLVGPDAAQAALLDPKRAKRILANRYVSVPVHLTVLRHPLPNTRFVPTLLCFP